MDGLSRLRISWRRRVPAHPGRFLACLVPTGLLHGMLASSAALLMHEEVSGYGLFAVFFMVPAAWITGWSLRGRIATSEGSESVVTTFWSLLMGAWLSGTLFVLFGGALRLSTGDWSAAWQVAFSWVLGIPMTVYAATIAWPVVLASVPLTWLAILVLRLAAGGIVEAAPRAPAPRPSS